MQSDQKIGLCLLIGLLGFAAALGFGRRPRPDDSAIAQRVRTAASTELLPVEKLAGEKLAVESAAGNETVKKEIQSPETVELVPPDQSTTPDRANRATSESKSETIQELSQHSLEQAADLGPAEVVEANASNSGPSDEPQPTASPQPVSKQQFVEYVVQPNDTLSGIAVRHLGDGNRYIDVYEANRDLLAHPDALQVGQTIRVPIGTRSATQFAGTPAENRH